MHIELLLYKTIKLFNTLKIPYMLTGSLAYNLYAIPRATRDIDLIVEMQQQHASEFIKQLGNEFYYNESTITTEIKRKGMFNIIHLDSAYKIDIILLSNDTFEQAKFNNKEKIVLFNQEVFVIKAEDLIISKLRWIQQLQSELHKRDIETLLKSQQINKSYILNWCEKLKLNTFGLI